MENIFSWNLYFCYVESNCLSYCYYLNSLNPWKLNLYAFFKFLCTIKVAHQAGEDEVLLSHAPYTIDLHSMRQINEDTGTTRAIQRKVLTVPATFNNNHQTRSASDIETVVASFG